MNESAFTPPQHPPTPPLPPPPPQQFPAPQQSGGNGRGFTLLVAIASALVVLGGFIGYSEWRSSQPSMDGLTIKMLDSMNESFRDDDDYREVGLHAKSITIMRISGNSFEGQAVVATRKGDNRTVSVDIAYDGDALMWRTGAGAFLFAQLEGG